MGKKEIQMLYIHTNNITREGDVLLLICDRIDKLDGQSLKHHFLGRIPDMW